MKSFADQFEDLKSHPRYSGATMVPYTMGLPFANEHAPIDGYLVTLPNVMLPEGWSHTTATLTYWVHPYFPCSPPSGFWSAEDLRYRWKDEEKATVLPQWTRLAHKGWTFPPNCTLFWHRQPAMWSANSDTLLTYAHFIRLRFNTLR